MTEPTAEMTIDELARAAEVAASTVRLYQHRGLLPPPNKRGRVGYYGTAHLGRLRLIVQLQARSFSLAGIKALLDGMDKGENLHTLLGLGDISPTWALRVPRSMALTELAGRLPQVDFTPELVDRIIDLGLVELSGDAGEVLVRSPSFLDIGSELAALGVPPDVILDQYEELRNDTARIAGRFAGVFRTHLWEPFVEAGMPAERITEMVNALEKLGSLAERVVVMALRHALQDFGESFMRAEAERLDVEIPRPGQGTPPV